jgi:type I restriction enzyme S subunit
MRWPIVPLGEVLKPAGEPHRVDRTRSYPNLGIYSFARGCFGKPPIDGNLTSARTLYRVRSGQFIYSRLFAFEGAYAVVPGDLDGAFVSNEFPCFDVQRDRALPRYLRWMFSLPRVWATLAEGSKGMGDRRKRVHPDQLLAFQAALPPLDVQRRIVARLDAVEAHLSTSSALRKAREADCEQLLRTLMLSDPATTRVPMRDLVQLREPDVTVDRSASYDFAGVYSFGRGVFRAGTKTGMDFAYPRLSTLRAGDFTYPKLMAWEGALGVVPPECDGCVVSTEFPVFELLQDRVLPEVLDVHFRTPSIWPQLAGASTGTNARRRRLNPSDFLAYQFPLPSRSVQAQVAKAYRLSQEIRRRDQVIDAETRAILPALLAEAFGSG